MRLRELLPVALLVAGLSVMPGCGGSNETIIPTDELTEEQKAEIAAEDERIQNEESGEG